MASIAWPAELPETLRLEGLSSEPADPVLRTDMDAGPAKTRLRYTRPAVKFSGTIIVDAAGLERLDYFYRITTRFGTLRFNFTNPHTLEPREYRFKAPPKTSSAAGVFTVTLQLEEL
ncbi:MAG: hypothetical protein LBC31_08790 [Treponema sp.]|jgi:hypothetical protein|nr:hypothetical protein [Treponema sp.]